MCVREVKSPCLWSHTLRGEAVSKERGEVFLFSQALPSASLGIYRQATCVCLEMGTVFKTLTLKQSFVIFQKFLREEEGMPSCKAKLPPSLGSTYCFAGREGGGLGQPPPSPPTCLPFGGQLAGSGSGCPLPKCEVVAGEREFTGMQACPMPLFTRDMGHTIRNEEHI